MAHFTALYDACVLYPAPLRDLLMHLALTDLFRAKWTNAIHDEWMRNVLTNRSDLTAAQLGRTRDLMNAHVRDALVENYEPLIPALTLPDADDRHVLAAAIRGRADVIVTFNLSDFPKAALDPYGIAAQRPMPSCSTSSILRLASCSAPSSDCARLCGIRQSTNPSTSIPSSARGYLARRQSCAD